LILLLVKFILKIRRIKLWDAKKVKVEKVKVENNMNHIEKVNFLNEKY
jgi:hypothetical protein